MALPAGIAESVRDALEKHGLGRRIDGVSDVGGGCINHGARVDTDTGASLFLKWNARAPLGLFDAEAEGLVALAGGSGLRVPEPIAWSDAPGASWLLMEYVAPGRASQATEELLGAGLARLHSPSEPRRPARERPASATEAGATRPASFGWRRDNWIGSLPQANDWSESWGDFWHEKRLQPQLDRAREHGHLADRMLDRALDLTSEGLADVGSPELVHGDLWGGNWFASADAEPTVIDPAAYLGHGEVDLAMSELFGGFGGRFYAAYRDEHGISDAYEAYRRELYQLYYLLVHVNLFGDAYEAGCLQAARRVVAALSG